VCGCPPGPKDTGFVTALSGAAESTSASLANWFNIGAVDASGGDFANSNLVPGVLTTEFGGGDAFDLSLPLSVTITGIQVEFRRRSAAANLVTDAAVVIRKNASTVSQPKTGNGYWPMTYAYASYGGPGDLWGMTWTPSELNSPSFAALIQATASAPTTVYLDHVRVTIYYEGC
jgi:hypothetical protein